MKLRLLSLLAAVCLLPDFVSAATAQARLYCWSLRFQTATTKLLGQTYTLEFTSDTSGAPSNGELFPLFNSPQVNYGTFFRLHDPVLGDLAGELGMDLPAFADANTNGFADFFESRQAVASETTQGGYSTPVDDGAITATWQRDAGSTTGTCKLQMESTQFGQLVDFVASFELIEYYGTLTYKPSDTKVPGVLQLQQTGLPTSTINGAVQFTKVPTNHLNLLALAPGNWTNSGGQTLTFTNEFFQRDLSTLTNYAGFIDFADGDPVSAAADYLTWALSIDDPNDSDGDNVPDLSDDPGTSPARQPLLAIQRVATQLNLTISGDVGRLHELEETTLLPATNWTKTLSLTLTNDPQIISLPLPGSATSFWRVKVP